MPRCTYAFASLSAHVPAWTDARILCSGKHIQLHRTLNEVLFTCSEVHHTCIVVSYICDDDECTCDRVYFTVSYVGCTYGKIHDNIMRFVALE